ncbi:MAG: aldo/keto reductase [Candidatus Omnitrophica bacterium]|nr:aldo/keto reductase [Candidatus Omnitrophota bacterium]
MFKKKNRFETIALGLALCIVMVLTTLVASNTSSPKVSAKLFATAEAAIYGLPKPTQLVPTSKTHSYPVLRGIKIDPNDPFKWEFILDSEDVERIDRTEIDRLINYFLAALTIPEEDLWVNLSPHEENRIVSDKLAQTDLGKDLLSQDYILKQLSSSLTYPETKIGKAYWKRLHEEVYKLAGTTSIPLNTFNKVWVVPQSAQVHEKGNIAFIADAKLKVMHEEDFFALRQAQDSTMQHNQVRGQRLETKNQSKEIAQLAAQVMSETVIPEIEQDINYGENFAKLRQIYHSFILSVWFKQKLQNSIFQYYIDQEKTEGIDLADKDVKEKIYNLYVEAYKKGVYNYVKKDQASNGKNIMRKYYSGGQELKSKTPAGDDLVVPTTETTASMANIMTTNAQGNLVYVAGQARDVDTVVQPPIPGLEVGDTIALGTYSAEPPTKEQFKIMFKTALASSNTNRLIIDLAQWYGIQGVAGEALDELEKEEGITRDQFVFISKVQPDHLRKDEVIAACTKTLEDLKIKKLKSFMIHWPSVLFAAKDGSEVIPLEETMAALNYLYEEGLIESIGFSNFPVQLMEKAMALTTAPVTAQFEFHPLFTPKRLRAFCKKRNIPVMGYGITAGQTKALQDKLIAHPVIREIADKHHVEPLEVVIRWSTQHEVIPVFISKKPERIKKNMDVFGFTLDSNDMAGLDRINQWRSGMPRHTLQLPPEIATFLSIDQAGLDTLHMPLDDHAALKEIIVTALRYRVTDRLIVNLHKDKAHKAIGTIIAELEAETENEEDPEDRITRDAFFLISNSAPRQLLTKEVVAALCENARKNLNVKNLEVLMLHWSQEQLHKVTREGPKSFDETIKALAELYDQGLIQAIGLDGFPPDLIRRIRKQTKAPIVAQLGHNAFYRNDHLLDYYKQTNIPVIGWAESPEQRRNYASDLKRTSANEVAAKHGVSPLKIATRWEAHDDVTPLFSPADSASVEGTMNSFGFELDVFDIMEIEKCNKDTSRIGGASSTWPGKGENRIIRLQAPSTQDSPTRQEFRVTMRKRFNQKYAQSTATATAPEVIEDSLWPKGLNGDHLVLDPNNPKSVVLILIKEFKDDPKQAEKQLETTFEETKELSIQVLTKPENIALNTWLGESEISVHRQVQLEKIKRPELFWSDHPDERKQSLLYLQVHNLEEMEALAAKGDSDAIATLTELKKEINRADYDSQAAEHFNTDEKGRDHWQTYQNNRDDYQDVVRDAVGGIALTGDSFDFDATAGTFSAVSFEEIRAARNGRGLVYEVFEIKDKIDFESFLKENKQELSSLAE